MAADLEGFAELGKKLTALGTAAGGKALRNANLKASTPVLKQAKQNAPVGTVAHKTYKGRLVAPGFLSRSVKRKSRLSKDKTTAYVLIGVAPEAYYGVQFIEKGTKNLRRKAWLQPAIDVKKAEYTRRLGQFLKENIEKVARKR